MKTNVCVVMLAALMITGLAACNNSGTKNQNPISQTDTLAVRHIIETGEVYTCKMHHEVMGDKPGVCPKCGMTLVKQKITDTQMKMLNEGNYTKPDYKR
jgi:hypothetical protein